MVAERAVTTYVLFITTTVDLSRESGCLLRAHHLEGLVEVGHDTLQKLEKIVVSSIETETCQRSS